MLNLTGNIFIDTGSQILSLLEKRKGSIENAIEFLFYQYTEKWKKPTFGFFPNSVLVNVKIPEKERLDRFKSIYFEGNVTDSNRDKIILSGAKSFLNFYPQFISPTPTIEELRGHLAAPLASLMFKDGLYGLMFCNNIDLFEKYCSENLSLNILLDHPQKMDCWAKDHFEQFLFENGSPNEGRSKRHD